MSKRLEEYIVGLEEFAKDEKYMCECSESKIKNTPKDLDNINDLLDGIVGKFIAENIHRVINKIASDLKEIVKEEKEK